MLCRGGKSCLFARRSSNITNAEASTSHETTTFEIGGGAGFGLQMHFFNILDIDLNFGARFPDLPVSQSFTDNGLSNVDMQTLFPDLGFKDKLGLRGKLGIGVTF